MFDTPCEDIIVDMGGFVFFSNQFSLTHEPTNSSMHLRNPLQTGNMSVSLEFTVRGGLNADQLQKASIFSENPIDVTLYNPKSEESVEIESAIVAEVFYDSQASEASCEVVGLGIST